MAKPFFTIGIMTYNYADYIEQAIQSVLNQSFCNWEMIIFDDASSDNTEELVKGYLTDRRISYVKHQKNIGQAANWSSLLKSGMGEVIATLHADDFWEIDTLINVYRSFVKDNKLDIYCVNWQIIGSNKRGPVKDCYADGKSVFKAEIGNSTMLPSATFIKRNLVDKCEMPTTKLKLAVDRNYFFKLLLKADFFKSDSTPFLNYRVHNQSVTAAAYRQGIYFKEVDENLNYIKKEVASLKLKRIIDSEIASNLLNSASFNLRCGDLNAARLDIKRSLKVKKFEYIQLRRFLIICLKYMIVLVKGGL
jgi:glycosyltransferase involved in cell wall biosynthesis